MLAISPCPIPSQSFLAAYAAREGHYADCFTTEVAGDVSLPDLITAFFGSPVLRLERRILALAGAPSTTRNLRDLAHGQSDALAFWRVEDRTPTELILKVQPGRIRTWLMIAQMPDQTTQLYFGSAVVPDRTKDESLKLGLVFHAFSGFHKLYARLTLWAAKRQLSKRAG